MDTISEGTTSYVTASFYNKLGVLQSPGTAFWTAIDLESGTVLQAETSLTPGSQIEITISSTINSMQNESKTSETRRIIVRGVYGTGDEVVGKFDYLISNMSTR